MGKTMMGVSVIGFLQPQSPFMQAVLPQAPPPAARPAQVAQSAIAAQASAMSRAKGGAATGNPELASSPGSTLGAS